jgi:hypothetical protein
VEKGGRRIAAEIKSFAGSSILLALEQALGQFTLYNDVLKRLEPERTLSLAVSEAMHHELFEEPIGQLLLANGRLRLLVFDAKKLELARFPPPMARRTVPLAWFPPPMARRTVPLAWFPPPMARSPLLLAWFPPPMARSPLLLACAPLAGSSTEMADGLLLADEKARTERGWTHECHEFPGGSLSGGGRTQVYFSRHPSVVSSLIEECQQRKSTCDSCEKSSVSWFRSFRRRHRGSKDGPTLAKLGTEVSRC